MEWGILGVLNYPNYQLFNECQMTCHATRLPDPATKSHHVFKTFYLFLARPLSVSDLADLKLAGFSASSMADTQSLSLTTLQNTLHFFLRTPPPIHRIAVLYIPYNIHLQDGVPLGLPRQHSQSI